jgi:O-antigen/teichoic acid export membrane protein
MADVESPVAPSPIAEVPARRSLGRLLFSGSSALGVAILIERGLGFVANLAAARLAGAQVFGAYSVALTTANSVASYAGAGIGTTANRFSGEYPIGEPGYRGLLRALSISSLGSATLAVAILWVAAEPLATHLLRNPGLIHLLRIAAFSAGAIILLECLRGLLIGQRRFAALLALCILSGGGLVAVLPALSRRGASAMAAGQATVALIAILLCVVFARKLRFAPNRSALSAGGPRTRAIVKFGSVQLASMIGINAAGWWIASLVTRSDFSLVQMGFYSVAVQMRNICSMPSLLISLTAYAQLTEEGGQPFGGPGRVTLLSTLAATVISLLICGPAAALMPWIVPSMYGKSFSGAALAGTLAVATGLVHMSAAPAAARLNVVSLRHTGIINGTWTLLIIGLGTRLVHTGGAREATATFLVAHVAAAVLVVATLLRLRAVPGTLTAVSVPGIAGSILLAGIGWLRSISTEKTALSALMLVVTGLLIWMSVYLGRKTNLLAREFTMLTLLTGLRAKIQRRDYLSS